MFNVANKVGIIRCTTYIIQQQSSPPGGHIRPVCISRVELVVLTISAVAIGMATFKLGKINEHF